MNSNLDMEDQSTSNESRTLPFEFRGDGMEYFKIWIVNVLLTIITIGIYSAWAKVRTNRYFYSNLYLDESNFRYLAEPLTILKGRIIAVFAFLLYTGAAAFYPTAAIIMAVILMFAIPYFVNQSLAFNHRMSAFKNIQFRFSATYGEAFMVMFIWPLLGVFSLGILMPLAILKQHRYMVQNSAYGTSPFEYHATFKDYGVIFLTLIGIAVMVGLPAWAIMVYMPSVAFISPLLLLLMYIGSILFFIVKLNNLYYRNISLLEHGFSSELTISGLGLTLLINLFLTIITLGLYLPAAKVRMTKYFCSCIQMEANGSLDSFAAAEKENVSALGEEFGQVFDFGI